MPERSSPSGLLIPDTRCGENRRLAAADYRRVDRRAFKIAMLLYNLKGLNIRSRHAAGQPLAVGTFAYLLNRVKLYNKISSLQQELEPILPIHVIRFSTVPNKTR
jgi:hypothetical protein